MKYLHLIQSLQRDYKKKQRDYKKKMNRKCVNGPPAKGSNTSAKNSSNSLCSFTDTANYRWRFQQVFQILQYNGQLLQQSGYCHFDPTFPNYFFIGKFIKNSLLHQHFQQIIFFCCWIFFLMDVIIDMCCLHCLLFFLTFKNLFIIIVSHLHLEFY